MKKESVKLCKYPKCKKEVHSSEAHFCLEHSREVNEFSKKAKYAVSSVVIGGAFMLLKGAFDKNNGSRKG